MNYHMVASDKSSASAALAPVPDTHWESQSLCGETGPAGSTLNGGVGTQLQRPYSYLGLFICNLGRTPLIHFTQFSLRPEHCHAALRYWGERGPSSPLSWPPLLSSPSQQGLYTHWLETFCVSLAHEILAVSCFVTGNHMEI